jgi:hypothetical protein
MKNKTQGIKKAYNPNSNQERKKQWFKIGFIIAGIVSTCWFLWRVIQKPSRVYYPCMQATAPVMSAFLIWVSGFILTVFSFEKARIAWTNTRYPVSMGLFFLALTGGMVLLGSNVFESLADTTNDVPRVTELTDERNVPMGEGYGIYNGRVVWVHDPEATNENCTNTEGDYWFEDKNTNQETVESMLADGIMKIAGENTIKDSWNALFTYHNLKKGRGNYGYQEGEKVCIKINLTNSSYLGFNSNDKMDATPQLVLALLKQLINETGIPQENITLGDPFRTFRDIYWEKCQTVFPNVRYIDNTGEKGRILTEVTKSDEYFTSDGSFSSPIPKAYKEAAYFINMPCLKSHDAAGITIGAKNHQGSVLGTGQTPKNQQMGRDLHYCYPANAGYYEMNNYRHIVDYMGNQYMGGNTVLYIVDAIWTGHNWNGVVYPWQMEPFNGDWMSSLFLSQDPVATESVGFDFLFEEYLENSELRGGDFPLYKATQDYIHQAADPANWPAGVVYDPENDGTPMESIGVHEHWNGVSDKQYTGNLGITGGIHLVSVPASLVAGSDNEFEKDTASTSTSFDTHREDFNLRVYPNPASDQMKISFELDEPAEVTIALYNLGGQKVADIENQFWNSNYFKASYDLTQFHLPSGVYIYHVHVGKENQISGKIRITSR